MDTQKIIEEQELEEQIKTLQIAKRNLNYVIMRIDKLEDENKCVARDEVGHIKEMLINISGSLNLMIAAGKTL